MGEEEEATAVQTSTIGSAIRKREACGGKGRVSYQGYNNQSGCHEAVKTYHTTCAKSRCHHGR